MKKFTLSSLLSQLLLLFFVVIWIIPTFGLFISSLRDKDLLAISGWWTSLKTTQVNEIFRSEGNKEQFQENDLFLIKGNIFEDDSNKKIISYGASYKSATVFNYCNIGKNLIDYVIDQVQLSFVLLVLHQGLKVVHQIRKLLVFV